MQGSLTANYITVATDSETSIHRGKSHSLLLVKLHKEVHNKMYKLPSEETQLVTKHLDGSCEEV